MTATQASQEIIRAATAPSPTALTAVVLLVAGALLLAWPSGRTRARRRSVLQVGEGGSRTGSPVAGRVDRPSPEGGYSGDALTTAMAALLARARAAPRPAAATAAALAGAGTGALLSGTVAAMLLAVYGAAGASLGLRYLDRRARWRARAEAADAVAAFAMDLRAGTTVSDGLAEAADRIDRVPDLRARISAAVMLADAVGAPLADVLDRLDRDLRAARQVRATVAAQAAGAQASVWLLAALPAGGVGLGALIGVNPTKILLHTPLGAACLVSAVLLQLAGVAWSARLTRVEATV